jgi:glyoxylase-like metal-dependent hydrolase (beta-lactamase superfamily II)
MYTGKVEVAGPADVRELPALILSKLAVGPMNNNAYLLRCRRTGAQVLIDAAAEPDRLLTLVGDGPLDAVITTHRHRDHWTALADVVGATNARTIAGEHDAAGIDVPTDTPVSDHDFITIGDIVLEVVHLRGHTPGSIALIYDDPEGPPHLWTGDCLFPGGLGNTFGDAAAFAELYDGVTSRLFERLPDETWVYPGHGLDTTLGAERPHLREWSERKW